MPSVQGPADSNQLQVTNGFLHALPSRPAPSILAGLAGKWTSEPSLFPHQFALQFFPSPNPLPSRFLIISSAAQTLVPPHQRLFWHLSKLLVPARIRMPAASSFLFPVAVTETDRTGPTDAPLSHSRPRVTQVFFFFRAEQRHRRGPQAIPGNSSPTVPQFPPVSPRVPDFPHPQRRFWGREPLTVSRRGLGGAHQSSNSLPVNCLGIEFCINGS